MAESFNIEFGDVQGFVVRGFGHLPQAGYAFFTIADAERFRASLARRLADGRFIPASERKRVPGPCSALGLTARGLQALAGEHLLAESLPLEFVEGMVQDQRSRLLGDIGVNDPEGWRWGTEAKGEIHGVLMTFAEDEAGVARNLDEAVGADDGLEEVGPRLTGYVPPDGKEPFGFDDGISQPIIDGTDRADDRRQEAPAEARLNIVPPGELILGYKDGTGRIPRSPAIGAEADPKGRLRPHREHAGRRDFGRNGSFVVIRQLAQDVDSFWRFVGDNTAPGQSPDDFASKMMGRTKDGAPLARGAAPREGNGFDYLYDRDGLGCPIGSHVRRTNPRSTVHARSLEQALRVTNRHRILRRGRNYRTTEGEQGILFICLNASISRQFEFVQATWSNNPLFQGLQQEVDPIIGTPSKAGTSARFTIPRLPYRHRVADLPAWVTVKGGAYFFLPSLSALHVLAEIGSAR